MIARIAPYEQKELTRDQQPATNVTVCPCAAGSRTGDARSRFVICVHLILIRDGHVLLGLRRDTSWWDGFWNFPAGHLKQGESVLAGVVREAAEEIGVSVRQEDLKLVHVLHECLVPDRDGSLHLFFRATPHYGMVRNGEPDKCAELRWWPLDALPPQTTSYALITLNAIWGCELLSLVGWSA